MSDTKQDMNDKELIKAMAKFMGVDVIESMGRIYQVIGGFGRLPYSTIQSPAQLNDFIEKVKMDITFNEGIWVATIYTGPTINDLVAISKHQDRTRATLLCAASFLNVEWIG